MLSARRLVGLGGVLGAAGLLASGPVQSSFGRVASREAASPVAASAPPASGADACGSSTRCGPCHGRGVGGIFDQWAGSPYAAGNGGRTCGGCHLGDSLRPACGGRAAGGHRAPGSLRRRAATVQAGARWVDGRLQVETAVCNVGTGHDFPARGLPLVLTTMVDGRDGGRPDPCRSIGRRRESRVSRRRLVAPIAPFATVVWRVDVDWPAAPPRRVEVGVVHPAEPGSELLTIRLPEGGWSFTHGGAALCWARSAGSPP